MRWADFLRNRFFPYWVGLESIRPFDKCCSTIPSWVSPGMRPNPFVLSDRWSEKRHAYESSPERKYRQIHQKGFLSRLKIVVAGSILSMVSLSLMNRKYILGGML